MESRGLELYAKHAGLDQDEHKEKKERETRELVAA